MLTNATIRHHEIKWLIETRLHHARRLRQYNHLIIGTHYSDEQIDYGK